VLASYFDSDWAGNVDDRKSTSGGCFYVGTNLVAWMSRKQSSIFLSTVEAEYITAGSCCTQLIWMKKLLFDYRFTKDTMPSTVTIQVQLIFPKILFNILVPSTQTSGIISSVILWNPR
jgi:hypothetical protein